MPQQQGHKYNLYLRHRHVSSELQQQGYVCFSSHKKAINCFVYRHRCLFYKLYHDNNKAINMTSYTDTDFGFPSFKNKVIYIDNSWSNLTKYTKVTWWANKFTWRNVEGTAMFDLLYIEYDCPSAFIDIYSGTPPCGHLVVMANIFCPTKRPYIFS